MAHQFYFTGYSDDIVIAGTKKGTDEHSSMYYRMSNGALVKAEHAPADDLAHPGWKITCDHPSATRIEAPGEDFNHGSPFIPDWMNPPGYADVLILEGDEEITLLEGGDNIPPEATPERIMALKLMKELNKESQEENFEVEAVIYALKKANLKLCAI